MPDRVEGESEHRDKRKIYPHCAQNAAMQAVPCSEEAGGRSTGTDKHRSPSGLARSL